MSSTSLLESIGVFFKIPAQARATCNCPNLCTVFSIAFFTSVSLVTSHSMYRNLSFYAKWPRFCANYFIKLAFTSAIATLHPFPKKNIVVASPRPDAPPVINTTRSEFNFIFLNIRFYLSTKYDDKIKYGLR